jgi:hypothetical protein
MRYLHIHWLIPGFSLLNDVKCTRFAGLNPPYPPSSDRPWGPMTSSKAQTMPWQAITMPDKRGGFPSRGREVPQQRQQMPTIAC